MTGLIALIEPHPKGKGDRPANPLMAVLRVHLLQNQFGYPNTLTPPKSLRHAMKRPSKPN